MARLTPDERVTREQAKALRSEVARANRAAAAARRAALAEARASRPAPSVAIWDGSDQSPAKAKQPQRGRRRRPRRMATGAVMIDQLVTPEARAHGDYVIEETSVTEGEFDGQTKGKMSVVRNRGGTTVERWANSGSLSRSQVEAIGLYVRCWRLHIGEQRVTANWSLVASFRGTPADDFVSSRLHAKNMLDHWDEEVFFAIGFQRFQVWQNVVLYDEPAGVAGGRLGYRSDRADAAAKATVQMIADMLALDMRLG